MYIGLHVASLVLCGIVVSGLSAVPDIQREIRTPGGVYGDLAPTMEELQNRRGHPLFRHPDTPPREC